MVGPFNMKYNVQTGDYVAVTLNRNSTGFSSLTKLTELKNVANSAWSGRTAVTVGGRTYTVPADVLCYNRQTKSWVGLSEAHAYASQSSLYVRDGIVRVIEVADAQSQKRLGPFRSQPFFCPPDKGMLRRTSSK